MNRQSIDMEVELMMNSNWEICFRLTLANFSRFSSSSWNWNGTTKSKTPSQQLAKESTNITTATDLELNTKMTTTFSILPNIISLTTKRRCGNSVTYKWLKYTFVTSYKCDNRFIFSRWIPTANYEWKYLVSVGLYFSESNEQRVE